MKREPGAEPAPTSERFENVALEKRQNVAYEAFALTAGIASAHCFAIAAGKCTAYKVNGGEVEDSKCGANLAFGGIFSFVTASGLRQAYRGTRQSTGPSRVRQDSLGLPRIARSLGKSGEGPFELAEDFHRSLLTPFPFTNVIDGYSGVIDHPTNVTNHEGEEWIHWPITHTQTESEKTFGSTLKYHAVCNKVLCGQDDDLVAEGLTEIWYPRDSFRLRRCRGQLS